MENNNNISTDEKDVEKNRIMKQLRENENKTPEVLRKNPSGLLKDQYLLLKE